jgi:hypothetical protein
MQQAVDAAEVDESAVIGQVLDDAAELRAFLEILEQAVALGAEFLLDDGSSRDNYVIALAIELDDLEFESRPFERDRIANGPDVDERARQERAHELDIDSEAAANAAADRALDDLAFVEGAFEVDPGSRPLGLFAREARFAEAVLDGIERDLDLVADVDFDLTLLIEKLAGITASDFRPALTMTTSLLTSMTVPVMMAPGLIC